MVQAKPIAKDWCPAFHRPKDADILTRHNRLVLQTAPMPMPPQPKYRHNRESHVHVYGFHIPA